MNISKLHGFFWGSVLVLTFLVSCKKSSNKNISNATGWEINSKKGGFQYNTGFKDQVTGPGLVFVEGGTFTMGQTQDDVMHDWNNTPNQQHVQSFYMDETEVTNKMYMEYLDWLKRVFPPDQEQYQNIYLGALPDTLVWRNPLGSNETMVTNYLRHPAYAEYPVVGVNWVQAVQFCKWRTDRVNEHLLEKENYIQKDTRFQAESGTAFSTDTYLHSPTQSYGGQVEQYVGKKYAGKEGNTYAKLTSGVLLPEYRLPSEAEWEYAAKSLSGLREFNNLRGRKKYPWEGGYTRSEGRKHMGDQLANFKQGQGDYGGIAGWSDDGGDITVKVKSYPPNDFGLYDMAGNVAEWVADVYRPIVDDELSDFNYHRGNIYTKNKIGADGKIEVVTKESIVYDTLGNGRIVVRDLPGKIATTAIDDDDVYLRQNFNRSDNRNYRDGDIESLRAFDPKGERKLAENTANISNISRGMYNSPDQKVVVKDGKLKGEYDKSNHRTTLIDDDSRVYKGGSWRDRAYWLDPAQRRYLPQYIATDYIGFRCAMSRVGSKSKSNKKTPRG